MQINIAHVVPTLTPKPDHADGCAQPPRNRVSRFHLERFVRSLELPYKSRALQINIEIKVAKKLDSKQRRSALRTFEQREAKRLALARAAAARAVAANGGMPPGLAGGGLSDIALCGSASQLFFRVR